MQSSRYAAMLKRCGHEELGLDFARIARHVHDYFPDCEERGVALHHIESAAIWVCQVAVCHDAEEVAHSTRLK